MHPYLYLAPRGQAKTYEAIIFSANESIKGVKAVIFTQHKRTAQNIRQKLTSLLGDCCDIEGFVGLDNVESVLDSTVRIFDEFDFLFQNFNGEFKIRSTDRFYGTPLRKRNLAEPKDNDILLKILSATKGHYHGRMWAERFDKNFLSKIKTETPKNQFELEFLGNFWEVE